MTQLLISVKNVEEAIIALQAGADIIDLKDPNIGALGALDLVTSQQIANTISGRVTLSATVGEQHASVNQLINAINSYQQIGIDIIKLAVDDLFARPEFEIEIRKITAKNIKLVAVFFAEEEIDLSFLAQISLLGFYGAIIDTKQKNKDLTQIFSTKHLQSFTRICSDHELKSGFAGSLRIRHVDQLASLNPCYMGFRGGVCKNFERGSVILPQTISDIKKLLFKHNNFKLIAQ